MATDTTWPPRARLELDPSSHISIKRDVHEVIIGASAQDFIAALHEVLRTPGKMFGLIEVLRPPDRLGEPFVEGDLIQGRYSIEDSLGLDQGDDDDDDGLVERQLERALHWIEDKQLSDYGLVTQVCLDPASAPDGIARFQYVYLEGTPIAGSTTFECEPLGPSRCCFRSIFEYQEQTLATVLLFGSVGLKLHNQVIIAEADLAVEALGARIESMDIPAEYRRQASAD